MEIITAKEYNNILNKIGVSYIGKTKQSAKMMYSFKNGTLTYCIYLAPSTMANVIRNNKVVDVCPNSKWCKEDCLNGSGHNKIDIMSKGIEHSTINMSRIKKTRAFYDLHEDYMKCVIREITFAQRQAEKLGMAFSVRLNGTSDLDPLTEYTYNGMSILDIFPNVQFYDYTKVPQRTKRVIPNYDVTLSFNGWNWHTCQEYLKNGGRVAVVFDNNNTLPKTFHGFEVIDANDTDTRYLDPKGVICGLHYHTTANNYKNGKYERPNNRFIVREDDVHCVW